MNAFTFNSLESTNPLSYALYLRQLSANPNAFKDFSDDERIVVAANLKFAANLIIRAQQENLELTAKILADKLRSAMATKINCNDKENLERNALMHGFVAYPQNRIKVLHVSAIGSKEDSILRQDIIKMALTNKIVEQLIAQGGIHTNYFPSESTDEVKYTCELLIVWPELEQVPISDLIPQLETTE